MSSAVSARPSTFVFDGFGRSFPREALRRILINEAAIDRVSEDQRRDLHDALQRPLRQRLALATNVPKVTKQPREMVRAEVLDLDEIEPAERRVFAPR